MAIEDKRKHLEFIQGVINRMGKNSFLIKGWTVTLVSALFALAANDANHSFVVVAYFPSIIFWLLDGYYLYQERLFRKLYDAARDKNEIDYSLNTSSHDDGFKDWVNSCFSKTLLLFYGTTILTLIVTMFYLKPQ